MAQDIEIDCKLKYPLTYYIPVNRPYIGGTVPLYYIPLSHCPTLPHFVPLSSTNHKVAQKDDSEKRILIGYTVY